MWASVAAMTQAEKGDAENGKEKGGEKEKEQRGVKRPIVPALVPESLQEVRRGAGGGSREGLPAGGGGRWQRQRRRAASGPRALAAGARRCSSRPRAAGRGLGFGNFPSCRGLSVTSTPQVESGTGQAPFPS